MDNNNQPQPKDKEPVQFDSKQISENLNRRQAEAQSKFQTRLTFKDKVKKWGEKPIFRRPRIFIIIGAVLLAIAGGVTAVVLLSNRVVPEAQVVEGSDEWFAKLDEEILKAVQGGNTEEVVEKIDAAIARAKAEGNKELLQKLYDEKRIIYSNGNTYNEAIATCEEILENVGESADAYECIADGYKDMGDNGQAVVYYKKALELIGEDIEGKLYLEGLIEILETSS